MTSTAAQAAVFYFKNSFFDSLLGDCHDNTF